MRIFNKFIGNKMAIQYFSSAEELPEASLKVMRKIFGWRKATAEGRAYLAQLQKLPNNEYQSSVEQLKKAEQLLHKFPKFHDVKDVNCFILETKDPQELGNCYSANTLGVFVNKARPTVSYETVLAHEFHHLLWERANGKAVTLGEALVKEGSAQVFEFEALGKESSASHCLEDRQIAIYEDEIKTRLNENIGNNLSAYISFFHGTQDGKGYPSGFGYAFSLKLFEAWKSYTGRMAADVVDLPPTEILQPWLEGKFSLKEKTMEIVPEKITLLDKISVPSRPLSSSRSCAHTAPKSSSPR